MKITIEGLPYGDRWGAVTSTFMPGFYEIRVITAAGTGKRAYGAAWINAELIEDRRMLAYCVRGAKLNAETFRREHSTPETTL